MKPTLIAILIAAAIAFSSVAEARKPQILRDTKNTIGWSFNLKTKRWKPIKLVTPKSEIRRSRNKAIKKYKKEHGL